MSHRNKALVAIVAGTALLISSGAAIGQAAIADERSGKAMQTFERRLCYGDWKFSRRSFGNVVWIGR